MSGGNIADARQGHRMARLALHHPDMAEAKRSAEAAIDAVRLDVCRESRLIDADAHLVLSSVEEQQERYVLAESRAIRAGRIAADLGFDHLVLESDLRLAHALDIRGELPDPIAAYRGIADRADRLGIGVETRVRALIRIVSTATGRRPDRIAAEEALEEATELAAGLTDMSVMAHLWLWEGCYLNTANKPDRAQELLELAQRHEGSDRRIQICASIALAASYYLRGEVARGDAQLAEGEAAARRAGMLRTRRQGAKSVKRFRPADSARFHSL